MLDLQGKLEPNGAQKVRVLKVGKAGNTKLEWGQAVLSVDSPTQKWVYRLRVGQTFPLTTQVVRRVDKPCGGTIAAAENWTRITEAQGGNYFTLRDRKIAASSAYGPGRDG